LSVLTAKQLQEWFEYYEIEPFGSVNEDAQSAYTRQTIAVANGMSKIDKKPFTISDWSLLMPQKKSEKKSVGKTTDQIKEIMMAVAQVQNKKRSK